MKMKRNNIFPFLLMIVILNPMFAQADGLADWFYETKAKVVGIDMSEKSIVFKGRKLSEAEFRNIMKFEDMRDFITSLPKPVEMTILDFSNKTESYALRKSNNHIFFKRSPDPLQLLVLHTEEDKELIRLSEVHGSAKEHGQVRILGKKRKVLMSGPYFSGTERGISKKTLAKNIDFALDSYINMIASSGEEMATIEISHTHPFFENKIFHEGTWYYNLLPLNEVDRAYAADLSKNTSDVIIIVRAILPNGYSYESYFYNGVDVTDQIGS